MLSSKTLFQLTAFATTMFVITVLAMVAMLFGEPDAPVNVWFNAHGATVMILEVVMIASLGFLAMASDRRETLQQAEIEATKKAEVKETDKDPTADDDR
jgi:hypothetical protein